MKNLWQSITDLAINVRVGEQNELDAAEKIMKECKFLLQSKGRMEPDNLVKKEYPPLLSVSHVMDICECSRSSAYAIMREPHRPRWQNGDKVRLHRDAFFQQLHEESRRSMGA